MPQGVRRPGAAGPQIIKAAEQEGKVTYYTTMSVQETDRILREFKKKYPRITTEFFRITKEKLVTRLVELHRQADALLWGAENAAILSTDLPAARLGQIVPWAWKRLMSISSLTIRWSGCRSVSVGRNTRVGRICRD